MSTLKVNKLRDTAGSADAITLDPNGGAVLAGVTTVTSVKVGAAVTISESGIEASGIGITCANINGGAIGGRKNIIINGAMQVDQYSDSTTSTSNGYIDVDRFASWVGNIDVNMTRTQESLSSSDTGPYGKGFRNYKRVQLASAGNANANAYVEAAYYKVEAQDLANSGWDYTSSSSFVTLSFWFRCSTNQTFLLNMRSEDGTQRMFSTTFTASANNTWTKIVKTIPGNTSPTVQIDNDNGNGFTIFWIPFYGTDLTDSGSTMDAWKTYSSSSQGTDMASTWLTAGASTFDLTGVQLEVGSQATAFEHRHFGEELKLCQRYYYAYRPSNNMWRDGYTDGNIYIKGTVPFPVTMRSSPSPTKVGTFQHYNNETNNVASETPTCNKHEAASMVRGASSGRTYSFWNASGTYGFNFSAEL